MKRLKRFVVPGIILAALVLLCQASEYYGWLSGINGPLFNWILATAPVKADTLASAALVIAEIDEEARNDCFNGESPLPPERLFQVIRALEEAQPSVIGVDILTDAEKYAREYHAGAIRLASARSREANKVTIVWASGNITEPAEGQPSPGAASFPEWLLGKRDELIVKPSRVLGYEPGELEQHDEITWALPVYANDEDETIRRLPRTVWVSADPVNSVRKEPRRGWARQIAEAYCHGPCTPEQDDEIYIKYGGSAPRRFPLKRLFACKDNSIRATGSSWDDFRSLARGRIILLGGTFPESGDFHKTPLGRIPGLIVNAYAVKAELRGDGVQDVRQPFAWMVDVLFGIAILWVFRSKAIVRQGWFRWSAKRVGEKWPRVVLTFALFAAVWAVSRAVAGGRYLLGFAGVGLGMLLHQLVELSESEEESSGHKTHKSHASGTSAQVEEE